MCIKKKQFVIDINDDKNQVSAAARQPPVSLNKINNQIYNLKNLPEVKTLPKYGNPFKKYPNEIKFEAWFPLPSPDKYNIIFHKNQ